MNLFGKIIGSVRNFFRAPLQKITEVARENAATSKALENTPKIKYRVLNQKGAFGSSRGQKFNRLAHPIGMMGGPDLGDTEFPAFMLYNLKRDIPGHPRGSSVARATVEGAL